MATLLRFDISVQVLSAACCSNFTYHSFLLHLICCLQPQISLPSSVISYIVRAGLPANIQAVARKAEEVR